MSKQETKNTNIPAPAAIKPAIRKRAPAKKAATSKPETAASPAPAKRASRARKAKVTFISRIFAIISGAATATLRGAKMINFKTAALYLFAIFGVFSVVSILFASKVTQANPEHPQEVAQQAQQQQAPASQYNPNLIPPTPPVLPEDMVVRMGAAKADKQHTVYVFSDPNCPYCRELESVLTDLGSDYSVVLIPVPVKIESELAIDGISCSSNKADTWHKSITQGYIAPGGCESAKTAVQRSLDFFRAYNFSATPTLISGDGRQHPGSMSKEELKAWLAGTK